VAEIGHHFGSPLAFALHGFTQVPFFLALAGFAIATYVYLFNPRLADRIKSALSPLAAVLEKKYGFDELYQAVFARAGLLLGRGLWKGGDAGLIDGLMVNGSAAVIERVSGIVRWTQSGRLYDYAFVLILGLMALAGAFVLMA
jgi:NADH-quinone oxidoreductase subunit L